MSEKGLTAKALNNRVIVLAIAIVLFVFGIYTYTILPRQEYPIVEAPIVIISVVYPGASAEDIENLVTPEVEDVIMKTTGFSTVKTVCSENLATFTVLFDLDLPVDDLHDSIESLRSDVLALKDSGLPDGVTDVYYSTDVDSTSGLILAIHSTERSNEELEQRTNELKNELRKIEGVKTVKVAGNYTNQIEVIVDHNKLNNINLTLSELQSIISYQNSLIPLGTIDFEDDKLQIKSSGNLENLQEIRDLIVNIDENGLITKLSDIATVDYGVQEDTKVFSSSGEPSVILDLYYEDSINITKVENEVQKAISEFQETLPKDIYVDVMINLADDVESSVNNFTISLLQSISIVIIVVMIGMSFKNAIIVAVAIPLSISIPFLGMSIMNIEIQFVSLAALIIALGMLVDNAIVVCDNIQVYLNKGYERKEACIIGTKTVAFPVLTSTLTTVTMFSAFYFLPGTMFKFSMSLPTVVIIALISSYIVSLVITPIMCFYFMKITQEDKEEKGLLGKIRNVVMLILDKAFDHKKLTLAITFLALGITVFTLLSTTMSFMPKSEKPLVDIKVYADTTTDIRKTEKIISSIEEVLDETEEVEFYLSSVGGSVPKYDFSSTPVPDSVDLGSLIVRIDLSNSEKTKSEFVELLQNEIDEKIGGNIVVTELNVVSNPHGEAVQIRLTGDNITNLNYYGEDIANKLENIEGTRNVEVTSSDQAYTYYLEYKEDVLNSNGLTKSEVANEINIALMGRTATTHREDTLEYPIVVKTDISTMEELNTLKVKSSQTNGKYAINQLANLSLINSYEVINKYNGENTVVITAIPKDGYSAINIQNQLKAQIDDMNISEEIDVIYEGDALTMFDALESLAVGGIIGMILILLILYLQFKSFKSTLIVVSSIPFCLVGATLGIHLFDASLDFYTILGIVSLIGVVVNNAIVLVDYIENENKVSDIDIACKDAVKARFRPVLLSTTTSVLGMVPLAIGGNVLFKGLAVSFMAGLTVSTCFTFIVIPLIYSMANKKQIIE
ncbi:MAG: efflux RND transporter permease subunit [Lachnospirales bacterium]